MSPAHVITVVKRRH